MIFKKRHQRKILSVEDFSPAEVFLDKQNMPSYDEEKFEGIMEKPINKKSLQVLIIIFLIIGGLFIVKLWTLQIKHGDTFFKVSENNRLEKMIIFSKRGLILDRNGAELTWNSLKTEDKPFPQRTYINSQGFSFLGYVRYPKKDKNGFYWRIKTSGESGLEKLLDKELSGKNGFKSIETDALMATKNESVITKDATDGENIKITIDKDMQIKMYNAISDLAEVSDYDSGAGVIMNVKTGEIITMVSFPDFLPQKMADSDDQEYISNILADGKTPFLNRVISGLYAPGSIVKPFIGIASLDLGKITEKTTIFSSGKIEVPNKYNPENPSIFRDWRPDGHGKTNIRFAIADSVNTFFYAIGGGYKNIEGIGIKNIYKYAKKFGFGEKTGIELPGEQIGLIPNPSWKRDVMDDDWRLGDTYITAIGQFGFQVTPLQAVRMVAAMANGGKILRPKILAKTATKTDWELDIPMRHFDTIRSGMRDVVTIGTGRSLNIKGIEIAAKTGTAQVDGKRFINSWSTGFYPYENPQYAFALIMEHGPKKDAISASWAMRDFFLWMIENNKL